MSHPSPCSVLHALLFLKPSSPVFTLSGLRTKTLAPFKAMAKLRYLNPFMISTVSKAKQTNKKESTLLFLKFLGVGTAGLPAMTKNKAAGNQALFEQKILGSPKSKAYFLIRLFHETQATNVILRQILGFICLLACLSVCF